METDGLELKGKCIIVAIRNPPPRKGGDQSAKYGKGGGDMHKPDAGSDTGVNRKSVLGSRLSGQTFVEDRTESAEGRKLPSFPALCKVARRRRRPRSPTPTSAPCCLGRRNNHLPRTFSIFFDPWMVDVKLVASSCNVEIDLRAIVAAEGMGYVKIDLQACKSMGKHQPLCASICICSVSISSGLRAGVWVGWALNILRSLCRHDVWFCVFS